MHVELPSHEREWIRTHLEQLGHPTLGDYYRSERWRERRKRYYAEHPYRCRKCGVKKGLSLNHRTYEHLGNEPDGDLEPLCQETCHRLFHQKWTKQVQRERRRNKKAPSRRRSFWSMLFFD